MRRSTTGSSSIFKSMSRSYWGQSRLMLFVIHWTLSCVDIGIGILPCITMADTVVPRGPYESLLAC